MKGFVPTPPQLVDAMVGKLFASRPPRSTDHVLDPGCGTGAFIEGVLRWCQHQGTPIPRILGIDSDVSLLREASRRFGQVVEVTLLHEDFLMSRPDRFDFIIGNPPYVPITGLDTTERARYRSQFRVATGRFDLYLLFFEQALELLQLDGRLVFVTPEKFLYVRTAEPLRRELAAVGVEEVELVDERTFGELITYPAVTTISRSASRSATRITLRDGSSRHVHLDRTGESWLPLINGSTSTRARHVLADAAVRVSCGVATGADEVYVVPTPELDPALREFARPTASGRSLINGDERSTSRSMLIPYSEDGALLPEEALGALGSYLAVPERRSRLMQRTCVARKPWYAFHETPPLAEILRPKILCKDIAPRPWFVVDESGDIVPRHSLYYIVPSDPTILHDLCAHLNSTEVAEYLLANCQRAANGFIRMQSHILKRVPIPEGFVGSGQLACV